MEVPESLSESPVPSTPRAESVIVGTSRESVLISGIFELKSSPAIIRTYLSYPVTGKTRTVLQKDVMHILFGGRIDE